MLPHRDRERVERRDPHLRGDGQGCGEGAGAAGAACAAGGGVRWGEEGVAERSCSSSGVRLALDAAHLLELGLQRRHLLLQQLGLKPLLRRRAVLLRVGGARISIRVARALAEQPQLVPPPLVRRLEPLELRRELRRLVVEARLGLLRLRLGYSIFSAATFISRSHTARRAAASSSWRRVSITVCVSFRSSARRRLVVLERLEERLEERRLPEPLPPTTISRNDSFGGSRLATGSSTALWYGSRTGDAPSPSPPSSRGLTERPIRRARATPEPSNSSTAHPPPSSHSPSNCCSARSPPSFAQICALRSVLQPSDFAAA